MKDAIDPLVHHAATFKPDGIPADVLKTSKDLFQDTMGCILSGSGAQGVRELKEVVHFWGGNPQATVFSHSDKTSAPSAAFLNSVMGHANDYDDTHDPALNHGCVTLVPALLAACEALSPSLKRSFNGESMPFRKISGQEFLAALAVGLDVSNRLGMAFIPYLHVGWLPTTLWGPFACAAACGRLLKLTVDKMHHAFGLAYSQIHANRQGLADGVLSKRIQPGFSASAGLNAAFFAANNLTGAQNIVDGIFGIKALYSSGQIRDEYLTKDLGTFFETINVSIKPYPCCRCTHPVIDAALELRDKSGFDWKAIKSGTIFLVPQSMGQIGKPFQVRDNPTVDAQFSAQYTAALTFIKGRPQLEDFTRQQVVSRHDVMDLASRFDCVEFEKDQTGLVPVEMDVRLENGQRMHIRITEPKGSRNNPLTPEELQAKFNNCLDNGIKNYSKEIRSRILEGHDRILELEDMTELINLY
ncbi:MAG: MmgE/PrpD family protein [Desulfohalobiaceae bacterium]|nr:MmgE/PrpD family protein [Desulfohalobiaceae bacterium]